MARAKAKSSDKAMATKSLREEREAVRVYSRRLQRAKSPALKKALRHARKEEREHAASFKRVRKNLGLSPTEHAAEGMDWMKSARGIMHTAETTRDPCRAVEHYTDMAVESTVAEVQFVQAGDTDNSETAARLRNRAIMGQRKAVKACRARR
jgi:rubrerythrin